MKNDFKLLFENSFWPQYRDADDDAKIGLRGYMNYFQDITSHHIFDMEFGNKHIYPKYGKIWIVTKYKLKILNKIEFTNEKITAKTWIEKSTSPVVINQMLCVYKGQELLAYGRSELCLIDLKLQKLGRLSDINFDRICMIDTPKDIDIKFNKIVLKDKEQEYVCSHTVKYTDLDSSKHMNNLIYVSMFINALDVNVYKNMNFKEFSITYLSQSYLGDTIDIFKVLSDDSVTFIGKKKDGTVVSTCVFVI